MKKTVVSSLALVAALASSQAFAFGVTDNALDLGVTSRDSETGFVIGGEGRPESDVGLAFEGAYQSEEIAGFDRTRLRVGAGVGTHYGASIDQYGALIAGFVADDVDFIDDSGFYVQARYEAKLLDTAALGTNVTYYDVWDGGLTAELYVRYQLTTDLAVQASYTLDIDDVDGGDDALMIGLRYSPDWL